MYFCFTSWETSDGIKPSENQTCPTFKKFSLRMEQRNDRNLQLSLNAARRSGVRLYIRVLYAGGRQFCIWWNVYILIKTSSEPYTVGVTKENKKRINQFLSKATRLLSSMFLLLLLWKETEEEKHFYYCFKSRFTEMYLPSDNLLSLVWSL